MPNLILLFSHTFTPEQISEAENKLKINEFINLPEKLQKMFSEIEPAGELNLEILRSIADWLGKTAKNGDFVLIQGEFGATVYLVDFCFHNGLSPIYATSKRVYEEKINDDGAIERKHIFKHVNFRRYVKGGK